MSKSLSVDDDGTVRSDGEPRVALVPLRWRCRQDPRPRALVDGIEALRIAFAEAEKAGVLRDALGDTGETPELPGLEDAP